MKKSVEIKIKDKVYELCYDIRSLARLEKLIGKSIIYTFGSGGAHMLRQVDIGFTVAGLIVALKMKSEDEAYDFIDAYCEAGGDIDRLGGSIIEAIYATGLFTMGTAKNETVPMAKKEKK